jgi:hypothetical protein
VRPAPDCHQRRPSPKHLAIENLTAVRARRGLFMRRPAVFTTACNDHIRVRIVRSSFGERFGRVFENGLVSPPLSFFLPHKRDTRKTPGRSAVEAAAPAFRIGGRPPCSADRFPGNISRGRAKAPACLTARMPAAGPRIGLPPVCYRGNAMHRVRYCRRCGAQTDQHRDPRPGCRPPAGCCPGWPRSPPTWCSIAGNVQHAAGQAEPTGCCWLELLAWSAAGEPSNGK